MGIWERSCYGAVLIAAIILIRALTLHKLPKKTFLVLWGIVILRLLLPFAVSTPFSFYAVVDMAREQISIAEAPVNSAELNIDTLGTVVAEDTTADAAADTLPSDATASGVLAHDGASVSILMPRVRLIWFIGMCICGFYFLFVYIRTRLQLSASLPMEDERVTAWITSHTLHRSIQIRQSDRLHAPLTYGIFHPIILLPKGIKQLDDQHLQFVLTHEYIHIRRFDALIKFVFITALCLHWFNPLVWMMVIIANRDLELSCDESVLRLYGESTKTKSAYAMTLLDLEEEKRIFSPLISHFNRNAMKERMVSIMKMKRATIFTIVAAILVVAGITTVFATKHSTSNNSKATVGADTIINSINSVTTDTADSATTSTGVVQTAVSNTTYDYLFSDYPGYDDYHNGSSTILTRQIGGPDQLPDKIWTYPNGYQVRTNGEATDPGFSMEFWNEEDYAKWLEEEKLRLQSLIGTDDRDHNGNPFTWTQEMVDQKIREYEGYLAEMEQGINLTKTINGGSEVVLKYAIFGKRIGFDKYRMPDNEGYEFDQIYPDGTVVHYGPFDDPRVSLAVMQALVSSWDASATWEYVE